MRRPLAIPMLFGLLAAQPAPELVISVGGAGRPFHAAFIGDYLATAMWSNVAIIDLSSGLTVSHLPQGSLVEAIEASPSGDLLAVGTCDHAIQLWNTRSVTIVRRLALIQECAESVSFSPDGALLATGAYGCCSADDGLQVWDVHSGKLVRELARGKGIRQVVFGGNGRWLAGFDEKGKASIFEWPSGRPMRAPEAIQKGGRATSSRDGRYLAWSGDELRVWDLTSGAETPLTGDRRARATTAEFLDDGRLAYVDYDEQMVLMRLPDGPRQVVSLPKAETKSYGDVGISMRHDWMRIRRDGRLLAGYRGPKTVVWDIAAAHLRELAAPALQSPRSLRWSSSGIVAWASPGLGLPGGDESALNGWDDRSGKPAHLATGVDDASGIAFCPDGTRVAVAGGSSVSVIDLARHRVVTTRRIGPSLETGIAFSPDGLRIAFASDPDGLGLFDANLRPLRRIAPLEAYTDAGHVAFSPDGRWIAAGLAAPSPSLHVWPANGAGNAVILDTTDVTYGPQPPAFSADSRRLASFVRGSSLVIWSTAAWHIERSLDLPGTGRALAFAPEGARLAVASDGEAAIWDAEAGRKLVTFSSPGSAEMRGIAWSPDGRRVVTSADDGVLRFWNASDGRLLASLYMLAAGGDWLLVAPDGRLDGSEWALAQLVAWRTGERIVRDGDLTRAHRVRDLWRSLTVTPRRP
jgi:WD40 repeat protein